MRKKIFIILLPLFFCGINLVGISQDINKIQSYIESFKHECEMRGVKLRYSPDSLAISISDIAKYGSYAQAWKYGDGRREVVFDKRYFRRISRNKNKLEYLVFHELAHSLLDLPDELGRGRRIMNAVMFHGGYWGFFKDMRRNENLDVLFGEALFRQTLDESIGASF